MACPRYSQRCLPCQKSGLDYQSGYFGGRDVSLASEPNVEAKEAPIPQSPPWNHIEALQDHADRPSLNLDSSNFSHLTTSECDSEPSPTLRPRPIPLRSHLLVNRPAVTRLDLEQCRQALRRTFRDCDKAEFRLVACLISCMLISARWLSRCEVLAAITLFEPDRISKKPVPQEGYWLRKCNPIVVETVEGNMTFRSGAMKVFLRSFSIQGIDASHRTLALICRNQIELGRRFARDAKSLTDRPNIFRAVQVFSPYVAAFGNHHLKAASLTSMVVIREENQATLKTKDSGSGANDDFEMIQEGTKQLSLSEERDDWVLLASPRA